MLPRGASAPPPQQAGGVASTPARAAAGGGSVSLLAGPQCVVCPIPRLPTYSTASASARAREHECANKGQWATGVGAATPAWSHLQKPTPALAPGCLRRLRRACIGSLVMDTLPAHHAHRCCTRTRPNMWSMAALSPPCDVMAPLPQSRDTIPSASSAVFAGRTLYLYWLAGAAASSCCELIVEHVTTYLTKRPVSLCRFERGSEQDWSIGLVPGSATSVFAFASDDVLVGRHPTCMRTPLVDVEFSMLTLISIDT